MKILFIGGTGVISSACSELCLQQGYELFVLNRGTSSRLVPAGAKHLIGDTSNPGEIENLIKNHTFDVVVDWIVFNPEQAHRDVELFSGNTGQYVFISSASVYQTPPRFWPVTEETPAENEFWGYSQQKIACENVFKKAYKEHHFPVTIVRPSHTYDKTMIPLTGRWTIIDRMRCGKKIIVHGDGASLWTLTHHRDFATGFCGMLGKELAIGETYHITAEFYYTWDGIAQILATAAGTRADIVHVPSDVIVRYDKEWGDGLLGDKTHSMIFDNSKIKSLVPEFNPTIRFGDGAQEMMAWFDNHPELKVIDERINGVIDQLIAKMESIIP